jgi:hypothetical protein
MHDVLDPGLIAVFLHHCSTSRLFGVAGRGALHYCSIGEGSVTAAIAFLIKSSRRFGRCESQFVQLA